MKASLFTMIVTTMATALADAETVNFDDMKAGVPPPGWTATQTGSGTAKWTVDKDNSAPSKPNVLKQSGQATFPVCFKNGTSIKDGFVDVKFKPIAGKEDQAGGGILRDRERGGEGKRVDLGGGRIIKKKKKRETREIKE